MASTQSLEDGVLAVLQGKNPPSDGWKNPQFGTTDRTIISNSSSNWPMLKGVITLYLGQEAGWAAWWLRELRAQRQFFMAREPLSRIYARWHITPVMAVHAWAVREQDQELRQEAASWLRAFWTSWALGTWPEEPVNTWWNAGRRWRGWGMSGIGARSFSRRKIDGVRKGPPELLDAQPMCWMVKRALVGKGKPGTAPPPSWIGKAGWDRDCFVAIEAIAGAADAFGLADDERTKLLELVATGNGVEDVVGWLYATKTEFSVFRFENGTATVMWQSINQATAPGVAGTCESGGRQKWLAPDPGLRPSAGGNQVSLGTARMSDDGRVHALRGDGTFHERGLPGNGQTSIALPAGDLIYRVDIDPLGARVHGAETIVDDGSEEAVQKLLEVQALLDEVIELAPQHVDLLEEAKASTGRVLKRYDEEV